MSDSSYTSSSITVLEGLDAVLEVGRALVVRVALEGLVELLDREGEAARVARVVDAPCGGHEVAGELDLGRVGVVEVTGAATAPEADAGVGEPLFHLEWIEKGSPKGTVSSRGSGFGTQVLERLAPYALSGKGKLAFSAKGVVWSISAPLAGVTGELRPPTG